MAYNRKEERKTLGQLSENSKGEKIVVSAIKDLDSGKEKIDIRNWYKEGEEHKPGTPGIRLSREDAVEVLAMILTDMNNDERFDLEEACRTKGLSVEFSDAD